jgi:hypothetical protein
LTCHGVSRYKDHRDDDRKRQEAEMNKYIVKNYLDAVKNNAITQTIVEAANDKEIIEKYLCRCGWGAGVQECGNVISVMSHGFDCYEVQFEITRI